MTNKEKTATEMKKEYEVPIELEQGKVGEKHVGHVGIVLILVYLVLFSFFLLYGLVQFWPVQVSSGEGNPNTSDIRFLFWILSISEEIQLLFIVIFAGALGGLVHAIRSFYWYVGHRVLKRSWLTKYILLPFVGSTLGLLFYLVIRGGFFSTEASIEETSAFGFAALAGLVGLFSEQAVLKLKSVAETLLAKVPKGKEGIPQEEQSDQVEDKK